MRAAGEVDFRARGIRVVRRMDGVISTEAKTRQCKNDLPDDQTFAGIQRTGKGGRINLL